MFIKQWSRTEGAVFCEVGNFEIFFLSEVFACRFKKHHGTVIMTPTWICYRNMTIQTENDDHWDGLKVILQGNTQHLVSKQKELT